MKCTLATCLILAVFSLIDVHSFSETLPEIGSGNPPSSFSEMWAGFDPRVEPLETELFQEWEEDGVVLRVIRFRIGVFKGKTARLAAIYGFPKKVLLGSDKLPALVQIHGGGQYADYQACLANAKKGYATVSIAWAGRLNAPDYRVTPVEVQLYWDGKTDDPRYRKTTDWGVLDGYHAPGRNAGNQFPSIRPESWTLDSVESPRNSGWFLCALAARRAITFLENQPEVDPSRIGVYGHSMGGKITVMAATDPRVKAAVPSCGGISDRLSESLRFRETLGDDVSLRQVRCPILFLSPSNDFHGRVGDLPKAVKEIQSRQWRVSSSAHHNHQDTPQHEAATLLWFDQHLKAEYEFPQTPKTHLQTVTEDGIPIFIVEPDASQKILSVDVFYTQDGKAAEGPEDREQTMHRFWHFVKPTTQSGKLTAKLPLESVHKPLWVFANVEYALENPVEGVGYYYRKFTARSFVISSVIAMISPEEIQKSAVQPTLQRSNMIEDFGDSWEKEWFSYQPDGWARSTNRLNCQLWQAPEHAIMSIRIKSAEPNAFVILVDDYAAEFSLKGGESWEELTIRPTDFRNIQGESKKDWVGIRQLRLSPDETLRAGRGENFEPKRFGKKWDGPAPQFRDLQWKPQAP